MVNAIGSSVGKIVFNPTRTDDDADLSYDYIGILVGDGKRVEEEVMVSWRDKKFRVWINEEAGIWVPKFYKVPTPDSSMHDDQDTHEEERMNDDHHAGMQESPGFQSKSGTAGSDPVESEKESNYDNYDGNDCPIIDINDGQKILDSQDINGGQKNLESQDFTPGIDFDFEKDCGVNGLMHDTGPNFNKRKKKGAMGSTGQINPAYSSSIEKTKVGKKYRVEDDLFGLDSLLGLDEQAEEVNEPVIDPRDLDLNSQPPRDTGPVVAGPEDVSEVDATVIVGALLGADLSKAHGMIQDSIVSEGLQGVKK